MATNPKILFDTCIFISYLRNQTSSDASKWIMRVLDGDIDGIISPIVDFELWSGVRDNADAKRIRVLLSKFRRVGFHVTIARAAGRLRYPFAKARDKSISTEDFIFAATAEYYGADILTENVKHFCVLPLKGVQIIESKKKQPSSGTNK